ncbi:MAG TPA: EamA family transporter [Parafilimonas sp.]|nr:EamA family transporter [Parafilimonas sp.]
MAQKNTPALMVVAAFATVYLVWGSTYFFIQQAIQHIPALLMGFIRFTTAGFLLLLWCMIKGENIWQWNQIKHAAIGGILMLFVGNGAVIWAEQSLPSSLVAVLVSAAPLWFVLLDKQKWSVNFKSRETVAGIVIGFAGVVMLFSESIGTALSANTNAFQIISLILLIIGSICWSGGSLYAKYKSTGSTTVNTAWQMFAAGIVFLPGSLLTHELSGFHWQTVTVGSWMSLLYLIIFGSLLAYSAYVWLLQVRPATQVSTYAYVNPVVAVWLGIFLSGEKLNVLQLIGLGIILFSVLLINISKYRRQQKQQSKIAEEETLVA